MTRIATPATIADAPAAAQPLLEAVKKQLGSVPNLFQLLSPVVERDTASHSFASPGDAAWLFTQVLNFLREVTLRLP